MQGTRTRLHLLLACALVAAAPTASRAQAAADAEAGRLSLVALLAGGTLGQRWENAQASLGPGPALFAGGALQYRLTPTLAAEVLGAYAWSSSYALDTGSGSSRGAGEIHLARASAGVLWRMRANVPGYFSAGIGALHYSPRERITFVEVDENGVETRTPLFGDEAEWMPAAHLGAGIDLRSGDHAARLDFRIYGSRSGQEVSRLGGESFSPRLAVDYQVFLGYVARL